MHYRIIIVIIYWQLIYYSKHSQARPKLNLALNAIPASVSFHGPCYLPCRDFVTGAQACYRSIVFFIIQALCLWQQHFPSICNPFRNLFWVFNLFIHPFHHRLSCYSKRLPPVVMNTVNPGWGPVCPISYYFV